MITLTAPQATIVAALIAAGAAIITVCTSIVVAAYNKQEERTLEYSKKLWDSRVALYRDLFAAASRMRSLHGGWTLPQKPTTVPSFTDIRIDFSDLDERAGILASNDVIIAWNATCTQFQMLMARARDLNAKFEGHQGDVPSEFQAIVQYGQQFRIGYDLVVRLMRAELSGARVKMSDQKQLKEARLSAYRNSVYPWPELVKDRNLV